MFNYSIGKSPEVIPGAKERIAEKLKDLQWINENRPCKNCVYHTNTTRYSCSLANNSCDFHHSRYKPIK